MMFALPTLDPNVARRLDGRQIPGVRLGHVFVRHPDSGALGVDVGIGQIGLDERAADRFRAARSGADRRQTSRRKERPAKEASRRLRRIPRRAAPELPLSPRSSSPHAPSPLAERSGRTLAVAQLAPSDARIKDASAPAKTDCKNAASRPLAESGPKHRHHRRRNPGRATDATPCNCMTPIFPSSVAKMRHLAERPPAKSPPRFRR